MKNRPEISRELRDTEWPFEYTDHDRVIVRAIVVDDEGRYWFVRAQREDEFGAATLIETSGGGVEPGEDLKAAIRRELREELGVEVDVLRRIGVVSDHYNLIHRHNINHYYLCRVRSEGERHLTEDEREVYHLSTLKLSFDEAAAEYENRACTRLGRLIANRELPILRRARILLEDLGSTRVFCFGDSNTYGYDPRGFFGGRYPDPWPEQAARCTGFQMVNGGMNGRRIPQREAEFQQFMSDAARADADLNAIMLGTNDLLEGLSPGEVASGMEAFLRRCEVPNRLLIAPPPMKRGTWVPDDGLIASSKALANKYRSLAERPGIAFADAGEWGVDLAFDGVHLTEDGHDRFARGVAEALLANLPAESYGFYGWESATIADERGLTPRDHYDLLRGLWCADTCAPRMRKDWTPENPTLGQCSITAFLMQDIYGGQVCGVPLGDGNFHCFNVVGDCVFDLTSEQFGDTRLDYTDCPEQDRSVHFAKSEKRMRYEALKAGLMDALTGQY